MQTGPMAILTMDGSMHREHIHTTPGGKKIGAHVAMPPPPVTEVPDATNRAEKVGWQGAWEPDCVVADPEDLENPWADMSEPRPSILEPAGHQNRPFWSPPPVLERIRPRN